MPFILYLARFCSSKSCTRKRVRRDHRGGRIEAEYEYRILLQDLEEQKRTKYKTVSTVYSYLLVP